MLFTVMAEYSEPVKVRGTGLLFFFVVFFFSPLPSTRRRFQKMSNPTSKGEVTDSFRHDKTTLKKFGRC